MQGTGAGQELWIGMFGGNMNTTGGPPELLLLAKIGT
jgi:hypothetical protein